MRLQILQEVVLIQKLMQSTFSLHHKDIVEGNPQVGDFLERWPALRVQTQVFAEFHRITNVNLRSQFYCELDRHTPKLVALYREKATKTGKTAEALRDILRVYDCQEQVDVDMKRILTLRALPVYLREDGSQFFKTFCREDEPDISDTPVALLTLVTEDASAAVHFNAVNTSVVVEDEIVVGDLPRLTDALVLCFGLFYALHLNYPQQLINTFTFIQKMVMCLDDATFPIGELKLKFL
ncbi:uncharacterized protein LOC117764862 [Hippoglossus hippoglossus]|uniref:uncharacterized protein LOC117764862 n=1 Tax=Hippoglossus hippoglossus TaxID=8267 RepID=UPI00148E1684|nr:uncharacterized protein LOC117764862 [Hippoglossus hippoglossus]